jgi:hypothetical protein
MANDRNRVVLLGVLQNPEEHSHVVDGQQAVAVRATLCTDLGAYGGSHQIVITGPCALRTMAHWHVCKAAKVELEVWIQGWLRSGPEETVVVVNHVTFMVSKQIQTEVNRLLAQANGRAKGAVAGNRTGAPCEP